jgi:hypothetical protein
MGRQRLPWLKRMCRRRGERDNNRHGNALSQDRHRFLLR